MRGRETDRQRHTEIETKTDRQTERDRFKHRQTDRDRDRDRERQRQTDRDRQTETETEDGGDMTGQDTDAQQSRLEEKKKEIKLLQLLLLGRPQSTTHGSLSPANPVIHRSRQAVPGDPGVHLQQINKCASLSSDAPSARLRFPQKPNLSHLQFYSSTNDR